MLSVPFLPETTYRGKKKPHKLIRECLDCSSHLAAWEQRLLRAPEARQALRKCQLETQRTFPLPCLAAGNKTATTKNAYMARVSHLSSWHAEFRCHLLQTHFCPCGCLLATVASLYQTANELHSLRACLELL